MNDDYVIRLTKMMQTLRSTENGCPWDKKQTYQSLTKHTLEETHEVIKAIEENDLESLKDELGDLLFQIVFYAQIASEDNQFNLADVIDHLIEKMQRRHPHVFTDKIIHNEAESSTHWEEIKAKERNIKNNHHKALGILEDIPYSMPALSRSQKIQSKAENSGFAWKTLNEVTAKLNEETQELKQAITENDKQKMTHEIGDSLFANVTLAKYLRIDAEQALRLANQRFSERYQYIETYLANKNRTIQDCKEDELLALWQQAKQAEDQP